MKPYLTRLLAGLLLAVLVLAGHPAAADGGPININTASATELASLSGIGPAKAQAIIEHREKEGPFKTVDDLKLVRGIGSKLLDQLRPHITVDGKSEAAPPLNPATAANAPRH